MTNIYLKLISHDIIKKISYLFCSVSSSSVLMKVSGTNKMLLQLVSLNEVTVILFSYPGWVSNLLRNPVLVFDKFYTFNWYKQDHNL